MIELRLFGALSLEERGQPGLLPLQSHPKCVAVLSYMVAYRPRGCLRRDKLTGIFWPDLEGRRARAALRKVIFELRQALGTDSVVGCGGEDVGVNPDRVWCDVVGFRDALDAGDEVRALDLYKGDLLDGFHISGAGEFDQWVERERGRLRDQAAEAAWTLASREEAQDNAVAAAHWARRTLRLHPYNEAVVQRVMRLLDHFGDRSGAVREFESFARRLGEELDLPPSPETLELAEQLRSRVNLKSVDTDSGIEGARDVDGASDPEETAERSRLLDEDGRLSVAVLPFTDLNAEERVQHFADGLHSELVTRLSQVEGIRATSRTSVMAYRERHENLRAIAQELGVRTVLEGTVRALEGRMRLSVELVDAANDEPLWAEIVERRVEDWFETQSEVASNLIDRIQALARSPREPESRTA